MSRMAANSVRVDMPFGWVVHPPLCKHPMIPDFYDVGVDIALAVSCTNIALQQGTDNLEKWCNKWL